MEISHNKKLITVDKLKKNRKTHRLLKGLLIQIAGDKHYFEG